MKPTEIKFALVHIPSDPSERDEARIVASCYSLSHALDRLSEEREEYGEQGVKDYHAARVEFVAESFGEVADWFATEYPATRFADIWSRWCDQSAASRELQMDMEEREEYEALLDIERAIIGLPGEDGHGGEHVALVSWDDLEPGGSDGPISDDLLAAVIAHADRDKLMAELAKREDKPRFYLDSDDQPWTDAPGALAAFYGPHAEIGTRGCEMIVCPLTPQALDELMQREREEDEAARAELATPELPDRFINHYYCGTCRFGWEERSPHTQNMKCGGCGAETEPEYSEDIDEDA